MAEERDFPLGSVLLAFLVGGIVGAGLAIALAPSSGRETRERLKRLGEETGEKLKETLEAGKGLVQEGRSIISAVYEAGREAMRKEKERLTEEAKGETG